MKVNSFYRKIQEWKHKVPSKYFVLLLAVLVGLFSGLAGALLKNFVHVIRQLLTLGLPENYQNYLYIFYPILGLFLTYFIVKKLLFNQTVGHGIPNTLYAISKKKGIIKRLSMINSLLTSSLTVGFGGSVGLEGPTIGTSAAIGSNLGRMFKVNYKTKTLLIACAASGALAAIFKAPIAAIVFAVEVIMVDLTMTTLIPLLLASVAATMTSKLFFGDEIIFHFAIQEGYVTIDIVFYLVLGVICGLFSMYFSKTYFLISDLFLKIKSRRKKVIVSGILLGILVFIFPPLYGEGFPFINLLIEGNQEQLLTNSLFDAYKNSVHGVLIFLVLVVFFKVLATTITFGGGGVGGIFAPTLFMGSIIGAVFAKFINYYGNLKLSESNFSLVAMAGLMAGILHAPLTAIFLIAEITGGYALFIPLMLTASIAFLTVKIFFPHSVYTMQLAQRGELITHHKDQAVLTLMKLKDEIETDFKTVTQEMSLGELVKVIASSKRSLFPVIDEKGLFVGVVLLNDIREMMFQREIYDNTFVHELMTISSEQVSTDDSMEAVMDKFERSDAWNLPVVENGLYIGFVSKSKLFSAYRKLLQGFYNEE